MQLCSLEVVSRNMVGLTSKLIHDVVLHTALGVDWSPEARFALFISLRISEMLPRIRVLHLPSF